MAAIRTIAKGAEPMEGRVKVDAPALAETGNAVQVKVSVESPMNERDRVAAIHILLEKNPEAEAAHFRFGRAAGKAEVTTRLRMFAPQRVVGVAELGDGSFWIGSAHVEVTLAACVDPDVK
ncbi:MAG TPA: thiosulfate oxidation carrier protein SoxY [Alphaproteobacteria bacterium]